MQSLVELARTSHQQELSSLTKEGYKKPEGHFDLNQPVARSHPILAGATALHLACRIPLLGIVAELASSPQCQVICFDEYMKTPRDYSLQMYLSSRKNIVGAERYQFLRRLLRITEESYLPVDFGEVPVENTNRSNKPKQESWYGSYLNRARQIKMGTVEMSQNDTDERNPFTGVPNEGHHKGGAHQHPRGVLEIPV